MFREAPCGARGLRPRARGLVGGRGRELRSLSGGLALWRTLDPRALGLGISPSVGLALRRTLDPRALARAPPGSRWLAGSRALSVSLPSPRLAGWVVRARRLSLSLPSPRAACSRALGVSRRVGEIRQVSGRGAGPTLDSFARGGTNRWDGEAESQWIVAARLLCHLQYLVPYLSRLQRIHLPDRLKL